MREPIHSLAGAGLAGALLAVLLQKAGRRVEVLEHRPDPRTGPVAAGRSINLALAARGLAALEAAGVLDAVLAQALPMRGRMIHGPDGSQQFQPYAADGERAIWSVSRGRLNRTLIEAAAAAGACLRFQTRLTDVDFDLGLLLLRDERHGVDLRESFDTVIGCDGAGSAVRLALERRLGLASHTDWLAHGYKELAMPPTGAGQFALDPSALHIWPRHDHMLIALPNYDRSFTCTLFLAHEGEPSFASLADASRQRAFFLREFPDAVPLIPDLLAQFAANPVGQLATLYADAWHLSDQAVLVGDAAHAIVPFHGQGMNCAFEDCLELAEAMASGARADAYATFVQRRLPQARAIAAMALENYEEMRASVADPRFLLRKALEHELERRFPGRYRSRYGLVSFTATPYAEAQAVGADNDRVLDDLLRGVSQLSEIDFARAEQQLGTRSSWSDAPA